MSSSPSIEAQHEDDYINEAVEVIRSDDPSSADSRQYEGAAANAHVDKPAIDEDAVYEQDFTLNAVDTDTADGNIPPPPSSSSWLTLTPKKVMGLATLFVIIFAIATGIGAAKIAARQQSSPAAEDTAMVSFKNNFWGATKSGKSNSGKVVTCIIQPVQTIFSIKPAITCDDDSLVPSEKEFEKLYKDYLKECKDFWSHLLYRILVAAIEFWKNEKCEGGNDCSARSLPEACQFNLVKAGMITNGLSVNETTATNALMACVEALGGGDADDTKEIV